MNNSQSLAKANGDRQLSLHQIPTSISLENIQTIKSNPIDVAIADWKVIKLHDPAARNWLEIVFCYPGLQALFSYRFAHWLYGFSIPFIPRFIASLSRFFTGIEIHPGATIGKGVFIDHGTGVVIGETAIVGDGVVIYQGVTLGGTGKETGKRHPTLGNNVLVGAGAKILGNIRIGDRVRIGAGSVVLRDVPSDCTVVGIPGRIIRTNEQAISLNTDRENLPDLEAEVISKLFDKIKVLEQQVQALNTQLHPPIDGQVELPPSQEPTESDKAIEDFLYGAGI
jgi:serine O-acetyltransferase